MVLSNLDVSARNLNTVLKVCYSAAWLAGVTCILNLTYKFIRDHTYVTANCWFCNENSRISFKQKNEWICPRCEQFNGFTKDGGYSQLIPEQYDEHLNVRKGSSTPKKSTYQTLNGLCRTCNANQELKIRQIACYVPLREKDYDQEIEVFKEKLERSYKLCPICEHTLENTLMLKSRLYTTKIPVKSGNYLRKVSLSDQKRSSKWKYYLGLISMTILLALLWSHDLKFIERLTDHETRTTWLEVFNQLSNSTLRDEYSIVLNITFILFSALFTKNYFGKSTLLSLPVFGIVSFVTNNYLLSILKIIGVIFTFSYLIHKYMKESSTTLFEKLSSTSDSLMVNKMEENIPLSFSPPHAEMPICGKFSDLSLGRQSTLTSSKSSYLFKSSKLLVQPPKLILDDLDEPADTVQSFATVSSGYESLNSFFRKSPDSVSEFDSVSQVGNKRCKNSRLSPSNALVSYARQRQLYTASSDRFYGVSPLLPAADLPGSRLNTSEVPVSAFVSTVQIFICSLAFFILGFSCQIFLSNLKF